MFRRVAKRPLKYRIVPCLTLKLCILVWSTAGGVLYSSERKLATLRLRDFKTCISLSVFQSKVLRRLYPATPKLEKKPSPPHSVEGLANKACVKRITPKGGLIIGKVAVKIGTLISKHTIHWELLRSRGSCFCSLFLSQEVKRRRKVWPILAGVCTQSRLLRQTSRHMQKNLSTSPHQGVLIVTRTQLVRRL